MKTYALQRRLAAALLGVGKNRVWFDPGRLKEIGQAITKADIAALIKEKAIKALPKKGVKRRAGRKRQLRRKKGLGRGPGKRKKLLKKRKKFYVEKIRAIRKRLKMLKAQGKIKAEQARLLSKKAKAGMLTLKELKELASMKGRKTEKESI